MRRRAPSERHPAAMSSSMICGAGPTGTNAHPGWWTVPGNAAIPRAARTSKWLASRSTRAVSGSWSVAWPQSGERVRQEIFAMLVAEVGNPYDANAIAVWIDGWKVGHLFREIARLTVRACWPCRSPPIRDRSRSVPEETVIGFSVRGSADLVARNRGLVGAPVDHRAGAVDKRRRVPGVVPHIPGAAPVAVGLAIGT
jgi:hypothetical protein